MLDQLKKELARVADKTRSERSMGFFQIGRAGYPPNDMFLGVRVPEQRLIAKKYQDLSLSEIQELLKSKFHEHRLVALFILIYHFKKADKQTREKLAKFYLKNTKHIDNWDLVDSSAGYILGIYLLDKKDRSILYSLVKSQDIWEKRISMIACFAFIRDEQYEDVLRIAELLLKDRHDLIHKAVGWMLREVGNRDLKIELKFLDKHYQHMPRTTLRYAIEKFPPERRQYYLKRT